LPEQAGALGGDWERKDEGQGKHEEAARHLVFRRRLRGELGIEIFK
jgi:hypothetical protein